jgi:hypothetical protein
MVETGNVAYLVVQVLAVELVHELLKCLGVQPEFLDAE